MTNVVPLAITISLAVIAYYVIVWTQVGRDPRQGTVVALYEPPLGLSPAMLRYVWKENFDDRIFWAGLLSLISKGLASLEERDGVPVIRPLRGRPHVDLPHEEKVLLQGLFAQHGKKGIHLKMLDAETEFTVSRMAEALRQAAVGRWFSENRNFLLPGMGLSLLPVCISANPKSLQEWGALILEFGVMAPGAFYLIFLLLRIRDLARGGFQIPVLRRAAMLLGFAVPCAAAIIFGAGLLAETFGWFLVAIAAVMTGLNLIFMHLMKAPTSEGARLLEEIRGFREFLQSVDRYPMDRPDAPASKPGSYEAYLPYAVALEVEQAWSDKFVALASTSHQSIPAMRAQSFYLGMWDGKPVEIVWGPDPTNRRF